MFDKLQIAHIHYQRAVVLEQAGRLSEAVEEYRQALHNNPRLRGAHLALAHYYQRHGLTTRAVEALYEVTSIEPDYEALQRLASLLLELKRYEEAREALRLCSRLCADPALLAYQFALIEFHEERYADALATVAGWDAQLDDLWRYHHLAGRCALRLGRFDDALASFGRAMLRTSEAAHLAQLLYDVRIAERAREFAGPLTIRDQIYVGQGTVCLGVGGGDDQATQPPGRRAWEYNELAATLLRACALARAGLWTTTVVVALARPAEPLAHAFSRLLAQPRASLGELRPDDVPLLVGGALSDPALLTLAHERISQPCFTYAQSVSWPADSASVWPDFVGMPALAAELPWEPALASAQRHGIPASTRDAMLAAAGARILTEVQTLPASRDRELRDYYLGAHTRLRWNVSKR